MVMRKTTDAALIHISKTEQQPFRDALAAIKTTRWSHAYDEARGAMLLHQPPTGKWNARKAEELEASLGKALPKKKGKVTWAWTAGGDERVFPGNDIYVLFSKGTSEAARKKILRPIKGIRVHTYPDVDVQPLSKPKKSPALKAEDLPGFSGTKAKQAWKIVEEMRREAAPEVPAVVSLPIARVTVPEDRREDIFTIAAEIRDLPGVRLATPDVAVLGRDLAGEPQQADLPSITDTSFVKRNRVDDAWRILEPPGLNPATEPFVLSREMIAVIDSNFDPHPLIDFDLIGYDAADGDHDPMTPTREGMRHGLEMSGVIGGRDHGGANECGIAPGSTIIPMRPSWVREGDFGEINGQVYYTDFDEYVDRYASTWIETMLRLYALSFNGVDLANMSIAINSQIWDEVGLQIGNWINWALYEGNFGDGIFAAASAGNNPAGIVLALPAKLAQTFAVGWGVRETYSMLGNQGWRLELVVDDGRWPLYYNDGTVANAVSGSGGSSVSSALVAGVAALMKSVDPTLTAEEVKGILRLTTRKIPPYLAAQTGPPIGATVVTGYEGPNAWTGYGPNYCSEFGHGFLDAHYALLTAWKRRRPAAELSRVHYRQTGTCAMIQLRHPPSTTYAGKRMGQFWALNSSSNISSQRWQHERAPGLEGIDQVIDPADLPFGEHTIVGDFDGDYIDEIALQLDPEEFWPQFTDHPEHSMLVHKYSEPDGRWNSMGKRSPYASGLASPQVVFPAEQPIQGAFTAKLLNDNRDCIIAYGDSVLNALVYNETSDTFQRLGPENYTPPLYSDAIENAVGGGRIVNERILKAAPLKLGTYNHAVLIVSAITRWGRGGFLNLHSEAIVQQRLPEYPDPPHLPSLPDLSDWIPASGGGGSTARIGFTYRLVVSVVGYDETSGEWVNYTFSSNPGDTHILLDETTIPYVESIHQGEFAITNNAAYHEIAIHLANDHLYYLLLSNGPGRSFGQTSIYLNELSLPGRISRTKAGVFGLDGEKTQLAWLSDVDHNNRVRFLSWDHVQRLWVDPGINIAHGRPDNRAVDLAVAKGFSFPDLIDDRDIVAILMEKPVANTYFTYRYSDTGEFTYMGLL